MLIKENCENCELLVSKKCNPDYEMFLAIGVTHWCTLFRYSNEIYLEIKKSVNNEISMG